MLQSPELPQWALKIMVPAVGALLALAAALAAACFVKAFGMTFLGRPRSAAAEHAGEVDRYSLTAMFILAALCLLAGILPGLVIDALSPVTLEILGGRMPVQADEAWLSIVPIAESRSSYNGLLVMLFIAISASLAVYRHPSLRLARAAARTGLGLRLSGRRARGAVFRRQASPSRSAASSARMVFHARDHVEMPPPGDTRPARFADRTARSDLGRNVCADRGRGRRCRPTGSTTCSS